MPSQPLADAGLFAGRADELRRGYQFVLEIANGNPRHMLITGPRGIGKSTLALAICSMARAERQYLNLLEPPVAPGFRPLLVADHVAQLGETVETIASEWVIDVRRGTSLSLGLQVDQAEINVLVTKLTIRRQGAQGTVATRLVEIVTDLTNQSAGSLGGILLYVDELDQVAGTNAVASFLKVLTESLAAAELRNVGILVVGQSDLYDQLAAGHASTPRIFQQVALNALDAAEVTELIEAGLFGTDTIIEADALSALASASLGFPAHAQLIGHEVFNRLGSVDPESTANGIKRVVRTLHIEAALSALRGRREMDVT